MENDLMRQPCYTRYFSLRRHVIPAKVNTPEYPATSIRQSFPPLSMTAEDFDEDFLQQLREAFSIEANELLQSMTKGLLELEQSPAPARRTEIVNTIFRDAHSMKGAAGAISRSDIESVSRALEGFFARWKTSAVTAPEAFVLAKRAVDLLGNLLQPSGTDIDPAHQMMATQIVHELSAAT